MSVESDRGELGLTAVRVRDNGHGIPPEDAEALLSSLGGSWKRRAKRSKNGIRLLHGEEGKGRFRALALGRAAEWSVTARNAADQLVRYHITVIKDSARTFRLSEPVVLDDSQATGVEVWVETWAQIIHDCRTRLKIFQKELNQSADRDASLDYLKETYARLLQGGDIEETPPVDPSSTATV